MEPMQPEGEFHHFQLVTPDGDVPLSVSILVHYNRQGNQARSNLKPITANDIISLQKSLEGFDDDFAKAFSLK
jgi:hypothetical protein